MLKAMQDSWKSLVLYIHTIKEKEIYNNNTQTYNFNFIICDFYLDNLTTS